MYQSFRYIIDNGVNREDSYKYSGRVSVMSIMMQIFIFY